MGQHRAFFILAAIILAGVLVDLFLNSGMASMFLIRKSMDAIEWIKFWD